MKDKKKWVIGLLCTLVCIMAVGYALLAQQLNINGSASIDSTWKVEITDIQEQEVVGKATSKVTPSYTSTTANFSVGLTQPGDSITYNVDISNLGTLDAKVDSININVDENDAIKYTTSGVVSGDKLGAGEKATLTIKVEYDSSVTSQPSVTTSDIAVTVNYVQDLEEESTVTYQTYSVGDMITFAGSNWYVIKNSTSEEDYVTLLKETVLTNSELGDYALSDTSSAMPYYWSDTCHNDNTYGYTNSDDSGCSGHNDYEGSKVKEYLEGMYINTLGSDNLKEVDGYKIRLMKIDDLNNIMGEGFVPTYATKINATNNAPIWMYQDSQGNSVANWWFMDYSEEFSGIWGIGHINDLVTYPIRGGNRSIRPVVNLLKSSI